MADKKDAKKPKKHSKGGISFEAEILLFVLAAFLLWLLVGRPQTQNADKPFMKEKTVQLQ